ncbi:MAG TPA: UDP-glucose/GDP-mannose dehydrogenase family protein [Candidatus Hydrogenedentes bacterium]|nr:UDP-glucose/GDP-mannose dehydrogenase family protein [Candidatus Hydrogenedentota bacterium]HNT89019.1 UDP-glucose/GDP-mannose dehydrogenase family protein [Candidatus Hydrogenedentota bacterium]
MKITIVGTGYQGLVTGTGLAEHGHQVACVDRNVDRIAMLQEGRLPIHEPGLEELLVRNLEEERLSFTTDLEKAVADCLPVFLCVGTPANEDGSADLAEICEAVRQIAAAMTGYRIIVNKSTCPPGTAATFERILRENTEHAFDIVVNPDFLREGAAVDDFLRPDRIVVGCDEVRVREIMRELYAPFLRTGRPFLAMSPVSAEMTKYATNVMLATRISLMNQLAEICDACGADITAVREGVASDDRIGPTYLFPGIGFGGSGLPKDLRACIAFGNSFACDCDLLEAVHHVNERQIERFLARILSHYGDSLPGKRLALWGVSFKPRTDDVRGAPALRLIERLRDAGASIVVYDPVAAPKIEKRFADGVRCVRKYYEALEGAHGLIIVTEWNEFRRPDYERMAALMAEKVIFDGRNIYTPKVMREMGFKYFSVGRPAV